MVTLPLPAPEFGLTVNQLAFELTLQATLEVTVAAKFPAVDATLCVAGDTVRVGF